jgi:arginase
MKYILSNPFGSDYDNESDIQELFKNRFNNNTLSNVYTIPAISNLSLSKSSYNPLLQLPRVRNMQRSTVSALALLDPEFQLVVIGGDRTISIGTGAGLSQHLDMSKVGLVWVSGSAAFNIPEDLTTRPISQSSCAINLGHGDNYFTGSYNNNFIGKSVHIGVRDVGYIEHNNLLEHQLLTYSNLDIVNLGINQIVNRTLIHLSECQYIWLCLDLESLDSIYHTATDGTQDNLPSCGLTSRELIYITSRLQDSNRLKATEIVNTTPHLSSLVRKLVETSFGLGKFRTNKTD